MNAVFSAKENFEKLLQVMASPRFLAKEGLGNEIPFFIYPFPASEACQVESDRARLIKQLENRNVKVLDINLFDLSLEILKDREILDQLLETEAEIEKPELKELLQSVLDPETHLVPKIAERIASEEHDVLFLSGIGEVYPYIRSHNVLNNLQSTAKDKPTVLFFPGEYSHGLATGASLDLFGLLHDDKYYRAFNILSYEV